MKLHRIVFLLCAALAACSTSRDNVAPDASATGMEHNSPTGASGLSTGTSNVINHTR